MLTLTFDFKIEKSEMMFGKGNSRQTGRQMTGLAGKKKVRFRSSTVKMGERRVH